MMGINLHDVVRGAITSVHPDMDCTLYQSTGQVNVKGVVTPVYAEPKSVKVNFQPLDADSLKQLEARNETPVSEQAFLYSNKPLPVGGIERIPIVRTGDFIEKDGEYWLITSVLEDWTQDGWANVAVDKQIKPPDFSASEWSEQYAGSNQ